LKKTTAFEYAPVNPAGAPQSYHPDPLEEGQDLLFPASPGGAGERFAGEQAVQAGEVRKRRQRVPVGLEGAPVAAGDGTREGLGEAPGDGRGRGALGELRQRLPRLGFRNPRGGPGAGGERDQRDGAAGRQRRGGVVEGLGLGRDPVRARAERADERLRDRERGGVSFDGDEGTRPGLVGRSGEDAKRVKGAERRAARPERFERGGREGSAQMKGRPAAQSPGERARDGGDRIVGHRQDEDVAAAVEPGDCPRSSASEPGNGLAGGSRVARDHVRQGPSGREPGRPSALPARPARRSRGMRKAPGRTWGQCTGFVRRVD
jgi:hypothetical protein